MCATGSYPSVELEPHPGTVKHTAVPQTPKKPSRTPHRYPDKLSKLQELSNKRILIDLHIMQFGCICPFCHDYRFSIKMKDHRYDVVFRCRACGAHGFLNTLEPMLKKLLKLRKRDGR